MARSTQFIGHTRQVLVFLNTCVEKEECGEVMGMFDEAVYTLHRYQSPDGEIWSEFIQAEPWSSGPMIFLAIKNSKGDVMGWKVDSIVRGQEYDRKKGIYWV